MSTDSWPEELLFTKPATERELIVVEPLVVTLNREVPEPFLTSMTGRVVAAAVVAMTTKGEVAVALL